MARALRLLALAAALIALAMLAPSGPLTRFDVWSYRTGLTVFRWCAYVAIVAAALGAIALLWPRSRARGIAAPAFAFILGLAVLYVPLKFQSQARAVPPINDISTDTDDPPRYMTTAQFAQALGSQVLATPTDQLIRAVLKLLV